MRRMNSRQATAERPAGGRLASLLEENGLLVIVLGAFAIVFVVSLRKQLVVDGWMAIVSGRWIVQHGLPSHDTLAVLTHGRRWTDEQWLAQLALYGLWRLGGVKLALFVHALLVTGGLAGAALYARTRGATARSVAWIAIPVMIAYYPVASVMRPQSFAFPLFAAVLWLVLDDARQPSRRVFLTLPLLVLWTNLHGSVVLGAMLVSLDGLVGMVQQRRPSGRGLALLLAPWACVFASPYGPHLPAYYEKILVGGDFKQFVTEWAPTTLSIQTAAVYLVVLGGLWLLGRAGRSAPLFDQLAFAITAVLAFDAVRNTAWIGLVALAVLPPLVDRLRGSPAEEPARLNRILSVTILAALVISVAARGGEVDELVHERIPACRGAGDGSGSRAARARVRFEPVRRLAALEQTEARRSRRVRRPLRAPLAGADPADRAFPGPGRQLAVDRARLSGLRARPPLRPRARAVAPPHPAGAGGLQLAAGRGATPAPLSCGFGETTSVRTATTARTASARTIRQVAPCELLDGVSQSSIGRNHKPDSRGRYKAIGTKRSRR